MNRTRWLMAIAVGLAPMLGSMAIQRPASNGHLSVSAASSNGGGSSSGNSSTNSSANSSPNSSANNSGSSSSSSSGVSVGVSPKAKVTNPHGPISTPCANCHTYTSWKPIRSKPDFNHDLTGYPLRGMHQKVGCSQCHTSMVFKNVSLQCAECHADIHRRQFGASCSNCHSVAGWQVSLKAIQNHQNRFPLVGAHSLVQCEGCHKQAAAGQFVGLETACYSCHQQDFLTPVLDHKALGLPTTCESCHTMDSWFNAKFDHLKYTGYALTGAHATLPCSACHLNNVFKGTSTQCNSCHAVDFNQSNNPPHVQMGLPRNCSICHTTTDWTVFKFDHALYAHYPLTGKHATVTCAQCHTENNYNKTPTACYACHQKDFQGATNPPHVSGGFPQDCSLCHTTAGWGTSTFNHNNTKFPLTGAHITVSCVQCHKGNFSGTLPTDCYGCHTTDYQKTNAPPHTPATAFPPQACATCHNTTSWAGAPFNHSKTGFALTGAHVTLQCAQCHTNNNYSLTSGACINCHQTDFNGANDPSHKGFPPDCTICHTTTAWKPSSFNHNNTKFTLTGAHTTVSCEGCHKGNYSGTLPTDCYGCHTTDYQKTNAPKHTPTAFPPQACATCHNTTSWTGAPFDHSKTGFPLTGAHVTLQCAQCHTNNDYSLTSGACINCHQTDFNGANNPSHKGFPPDCAICHTTTAWKPSSFNHNNTKFTLTGAHTTVSCEGCHKGNYSGTLPTDCYGCHTTDYQKTNAPKHTPTAFPPQACATCHNTTSWTGAPFDHSKTGFPLTGAHVTLQCAQCHTNNNYSLTSGACINCHQTDFNGANNPSHKGFPPDCAICHTTTAWKPSSFNHNNTKFTLTGAHTTVSCEGCHKGNYSGTLPTDCFGCHTTDYQKTNAPKHTPTAFPPQACATCHNTTNWTGAPFDHSKTGFALTGAHVTLQCEQCHVNNNYSLTSGACINCHQTDFNGANNPSHKGFPPDCAICHTTIAWTPSSFDHSTTKFPLTGAHTTVSCDSCHKGNYSGTVPTDCYSCHTTDYQKTNAPKHTPAAFPPTACATCHNTTSWTAAGFNHNNTGFPLTGAHTSLPCVQCHVNNNYNLNSPDCINCHQTDFKGAISPINHAGFPTDCTICHNTSLWTQATFNHSTTKFPLTGAHTTVSCDSCHKGDYSGTLPTDCYSCHSTDYNNTNNPPHASANYPTTCQVCHSTTSWAGAKFDHSKTGFPLTGAHTSLPCVQCHVNNNYNLNSAACINCHQTDFNGALSPINHTGFPTDCTLCHNTSLWTQATFNHNSTAFPLTGAHTSVSCNTCHKGNYSSTVPTDCFSCHTTDYNKTNNPPHAAANYPTTCQVCHSTTSWAGAKFDHSKTGFPLTGAHTSLPCVQCHVNNNYNLNSAACINCHQTDFKGALSPINHTGFPTDCTICHNTTLWTQATFNHNSTTFPLTGAHTSVSCNTCHNGNYSSTLPTGCYSCHTTDYNKTNNPPHAAANYPTTCQVCHSTTSWAGATFDHSKTGFPLTGAHTTVQCALCHVNNNYNLNSAACINCHQTDFKGAISPINHTGFPTDCTICHNTSLWTQATFNHSTTKFPLTGAHTTVSCDSCHKGNYSGTLPTDCYSCHTTDYNNTNNPPHAAANYPTTCQVCHTTTSWAGATFDHSKTGFPLTGAHTTLQCAQCHTNNNYSLNSAACINCHQTDFNGALSPVNHAGYPTDCTLCHNTTLWTQATFNHSTFFVLVGAHTTLQCAQCHKNNNYTTVPTTCIGCHQTDFSGTANPNHTTAKFPTTCNTCHNNTAWIPVATFNHTLYGNYTLTGFHTTVTCAACHVNDNYNLTSSACVNCHQTDYNNTTNPPHKASNYPTTCDTCHTTTNWAGATFNHNSTGFPLTGAHTTLQCSQCHVNNNYNLTAAQALCSNCHMTDYNGTTNPNHKSAGFPTTCDTCHSTTNWTSATFNHNNTGFPLTGAHTTVQCALCHVNNNYNLGAMICSNCHTTDYNNTTNPNHKSAGWPTTCDTCHTTTAWLPATLPSSYHTFFPLNHGNANGVCATCHTNSSDYSVFTCTGCHGGNNAANFNHPNVNGYVYNSVNCLACHKNGGGG